MIKDVGLPRVEKSPPIPPVVKEMLGWLNASLKSTETRDELSSTPYLQSKIKFKSYVKMPVSA